MPRIDVVPLQSVGGIRFGMTREEVRGALSGVTPEPFLKFPDDDEPTDDFGFCHVYYAAGGICEAVEIFEEAEVYIDGKLFFPQPVRKMKKALPGFAKDEDGLLNEELSIGVYAPDGEPESVLFGKKDYYNE